MVNFETANARLTSLTTLMGSLSLISLLLSINIMSGKDRPLTTSLFVAESLNIIFLLTSIVLFFTSAAILASAYFESGVEMKIGVKRTRRLLVSGTVLTLWALAPLFLVAFNFSAQAITYSIAAIIAPFVFLIVRKKQGIAL